VPPCLCFLACLAASPATAQPFPGNPDLLARPDLKLDELFNRLPDYKLGDDRTPLEFLAANVAAASKDMAAPETRDLARRLAGLLDVPSSYDCKDYALRQLLMIAGRDEVPAIAKRIDDPGLGHMAIAVLERMENEAADKALRDQLLLLSQDSRIMTINALGNRRDQQAVQLFKELLCECEPSVAAATLAALGTIATDDARRLIETKKQAEDPTVRFASLDALLRVATGLLAGGRNNEAAGIFQNIFEDEKAPDSLRRGGLRGWVMSRPDRGVPRLVELLRSNDSAQQTMAIHVMRDIPPGKSEKIADSFGKYSPAVQVKVLNMFALRHDPAAKLAAEAALKSPDAEVRKAAESALKPLPAK
jgi:HEAT repeat protein